MKKTIVSMLVALTFAVGAQAQDKVVVNKHNGDSQSFEMSNVRKITLSETGMNIIGTDGTTNATVNYIDIKTITFELVNGIEQVVNTEQGKLTLLKDGNYIRIKGFNGENGKVAIYKSDGTMVETATFTGADLAIGIEDLPRGLYILNVNGQSLKFTR